MEQKIKMCLDKKIKTQSTLFEVCNIYKKNTENLISKDGDLQKSDSLTTDYLEDVTEKTVQSTDLSFSGIKQQKTIKIAIWREKKWEIGKTINVKFLDGSTYLKEMVMEKASEWTKFANISFNFIDQGNAEIRISFQQGTGSWSYVGVDCLSITDQNEATMNFGWFDETTEDEEFSRTVIHEFGHALGCIHEHQSPVANIPWDKPAVYKYYAKEQGWSKSEVDNNIFNTYDSSVISNSKFDSHSIMLYPISANLTKNRYSVEMNVKLSEKDIEYIKKWYPGK